jgi:hypothetical protein
MLPDLDGGQPQEATGGKPPQREMQSRVRRYPGHCTATSGPQWRRLEDRVEVAQNVDCRATTALCPASRCNEIMPGRFSG